MRETKVGKKLKERKQRGITLVALVVTIVVLIILATISISALFGENGIIQKAKETKEMQANSVIEQETEMDKLVAEYANAMAEPEVSEWGYGAYDQETQTVTNGEITLKIGDYVDYDHVTGATTLSYTSEQAKNGYGDQTFTLANYDYGWRVLGVDDDGRLLLISEDFVQPTSGGYVDSTYNRTYFYLGGTDATGGLNFYVNGVGELDNICTIYGQGYGAVEVRCVNVSDINKITGYNPETAGYVNTEILTRQYGNEITYTKKDGYIYYQGTKYPTTLTKSDITFFRHFTENGWNILAEGGTVNLTSTGYVYYPNTLTAESSNEDGTEPGISTTSTVYKMLFTNSSTGAYKEGSGTIDGFRYWLADSIGIGYEGYFTYGTMRIYKGIVSEGALLSTTEGYWPAYQGIRPVVTLSDDAQLQYSGKTKDGCNLYNIY